MATAEQSQPSELGLADAAERISGLMDGSDPQPAPRSKKTADAEVEETEASGEEDYETLSEEDMALEADAESSLEDEESDSVEATEEDDSEDDSQDQFVTVKIDGKTQQIPLKEALAGYQRQADYQRKTQAVAIERRAVDEERGYVQQERSHYLESLEQLEQGLAALVPQEPNWVALHEEDPFNFPLIEKQWRDYQTTQASIQQEKQRVIAIEQQETHSRLSHQVSQAKTYLMEKMPEWSDPEKWSAAQSKLRDYGRNMGYSDEELSKAYDPRAILVIEKARRYDALRANRPRPDKGKAPKPVRSAASTSSPKRTTDITRMQTRLRSSGHINDAAALIGLLDRR